MPHSFAVAHLDRLSFSAEDLATLASLGAARGRQELVEHRVPEALRTLRMTAIIESSESSNRIEGVTASRRRIEALLLRPTEPRNRSEQEIAGYRDALTLIHESHASMPFTVGVVLQLHQMLFRYHADQGGRFKMEDNRIVERDARGEVIRVRFEATPAVSTPGAMESLVLGYRTAIAAPRRLQALVAVPLAVLDFLCIHPFADGNGRVARLIALVLLYHHGERVGRYVSLERVLEDSKTSYYETLAQSSIAWHDGTHDVMPWLRYFWGTLTRAYRELDERIGSLDGSTTKAERVRTAISRQVKPFTRAELLRECPGVSAELVRVVLRQLRAEGRVTTFGRGPGARWQLVP